jgi:exopolysaccharide biosynthesis polyprenyl glycosylphosphotransferase
VKEEYERYIKLTLIHNEFVGCFGFDDDRIKPPSKFERYLIDNRIDEVVIAYNHRSDFDYTIYMRICETMGLTIRLLMDMVEMPISQKFVSSIGTFPVITYHSVPMDKMQLFVKSVIDVVLSALAVLLTSPILLLTAIAIKLESPGPVFFRQKRVGMNGKEFKIIKFRSMYIDAEDRKKDLAALNKIGDARMFKIDDDPRVTKVGRFLRKYSIDELPQFINVLKREMSLVGTRPPTVDEVEIYESRHRRRLSIRPGITGLWQVSGRSDITDFETVVALDTKYIDEWSLGLDLRLLFLTVGVVFAKRGSY